MSTEESKKPIISTKCSKCAQVVRFYSPAHIGVVMVRCPNGECGHPFGVRITEKEIKFGGVNNQEEAAQEKKSHPVTDPIINTKGTPTGGIARLLQKKRHFFNKDKYHALNLGANTVGMDDPSLPSDIMIEGDRTISHRSITILVEAVGSSYKYLLTVNKSKNPVYLSGKVIPVGTSLYIQLGQELILGKTHFYLTNERL